MKSIVRKVLVGIIFLNLLISCKMDSEEVLNQNNVNSFTMIVNEQEWLPSVIDPCHRTFQCSMGELGQSKYYEIDAFRDPSSTSNLESENIFELTVMDVNLIGDYTIDGEFKDFSNYARFTINDINGKRIYQNKENGSEFNVSVNQLFPKKNSDLVGIAGSFSGVLYNINNPVDSIIINQGEFIFRKTNWYNFNQCEE